MTEADLQRLVTDAAVVYGWHWAHFRPAQTARGWRTPVEGTIGQGFPDLVLIRERDRRLMFVELKSSKGKLTPQQENVQAVMSTVAPYYVVRPETVDEFFFELR